MKLFCLFLVMFSLSATHLHAQESRQSIPLKEVSSDVNKESRSKEAPNMTNTRMAADLGSPSPWSMRLDLDYRGGSVNDPFGADRPNYRRLAGNPIADTMLNTNVGVAYRLDPRTQLRFNTGLSYRTPFVNSMDDIRNNRTAKSKQTLFNVVQVQTEYSHSNRVGNWMYSPSVTLNIATDPFLTNVVGQAGVLSGTFRFMYEFERSGWQLGATSFWNEVFYRDEAPFDRRKRARPVSSLGIVPIVEYKFNDKWSSRNSLGFINYTHFRHRPPYALDYENPFVSIGVTYAPRKGMWINPSVQFNPNEIKAELTNVSIGAVFNFF